MKQGSTLAVIGYGTIVKLALETIAREIHAPLDSILVYARTGSEAKARERIESIGSELAREIIITSDISELAALRPTLAVEAAGHQALRETGIPLLSAGIDLVVTSVGALADEELRNSLDKAAGESGARYDVIAGAIGGLDILAAAKLAGIDSVTYTGRKPPTAWKGTRAETLLDLDAITAESTFFEGDAGTAARDYPQNANVAATLALAGAGFGKTRVRLIADPAISRNVHEIVVRSACADFSFRVEGRIAPDNPKTSLTVAYSLASAILQRLQLGGG